MTEERKCPQCGGAVIKMEGRGRQPTYCGSTCRRAAARERRMAAGLCASCGKYPVEEGMTNCRICKDRVAAFQRARTAAKPNPRCKTCGREFERGGSRQVYCSETCAPKTMPRRYNLRQCPACSVIFTPKRERQPTCGKDECRAEYRNIAKRRNYARNAVPNPSIPCAQCREPFSPRRLGAIYCSKRCSSRASRVRNGRVKSIPLRACKSCGDTFEPRTHNQSYCSEACRPNYYVHTLPRIPCEICGIEFQPRLGTQVVCSSVGCRRERARLRYKPKFKRHEDELDRAIIYGGTFTEREQQAADDHYHFLVIWADVYRKNEETHRAIAEETEAERSRCTPRYLHGLGVGRKQQVRQWLGIRKGGDDDPYRRI